MRVVVSHLVVVVGGKVGGWLMLGLCWCSVCGEGETGKWGTMLVGGSFLDFTDVSRITGESFCAIPVVWLCRGEDGVLWRQVA